MKFLVNGGTYTMRYGGVVVLYKLSRILSNLGHEVYIVADKYHDILNDSNCKILDVPSAKELCKNEDIIVILPEATPHDPYNAKYVVRWVLYYPGANGGTTTYDESDFVFCFNRTYVAHTQYRDAPELFLIDTNLNNFYSTNKERKSDALLLKKATPSYHDRYLNYYMNHASMLYQDVKCFDFLFLDPEVSADTLNNEFNEIRYFISFDIETYHSILAALAGCISVVVPVPGLEGHVWREQHPILKYGVAYGFEDIDWAINTRQNLIDHLQNIEDSNISQVKNFISLIKDKWNIEN